jgi:acetolactate synthase-1/2/3 large subunit
VFIEVPVDLLYHEDLVREWYLTESGVKHGKSLGAKALGVYLKGHLYRQFHQPYLELELPMPQPKFPTIRGSAGRIRDVAKALETAQRPALVLGSQTLVNTPEPERVADAVRALGVPVWLGGMARGLLGRRSDVQFRHKRTKALKEADLVIVCGFPFDFRLGYGRSIGSKATLVAANLSASDLKKNRRPEIALHMHPGEFLVQLAAKARNTGTRADWFATLREREAARDAEIVAIAKDEPAEGLVNPIELCLRLEEAMSDDAALVVDGGDFVGTAAYTLRPRAPLSWLDPGVFGTLGVGGGFAVGASVVKPGREVWLIYGDGSSGYSLAEFDTYARHGLAPIAVVGTDGSWAQIARDQVEILGDDVGTVLNRTAYHTVAEGYGGKGLLLTDPAKIDATLAEAKALAAAGTAVCINVHIAGSDFRKGSLSM